MSRQINAPSNAFYLCKPAPIKFGFLRIERVSLLHLPKHRNRVRAFRLWPSLRLCHSAPHHLCLGNPPAIRQPLQASNSFGVYANVVRWVMTAIPSLHTIIRLSFLTCSEVKFTDRPTERTRRHRYRITSPNPPHQSAPILPHKTIFLEISLMDPASAGPLRDSICRTRFIASIISCRTPSISLRQVRTVSAGTNPSSFRSRISSAR